MFCRVAESNLSKLTPPLSGKSALSAGGGKGGIPLVSPVVGAPKVSVIMPVYNAAKYLSEAIASILLQKELPEIELICVDDGSTDDSSAILKLWKGRDSRLHVLNQTNQGPGVARNAGMDVAKGEYICFLDADDTIASGAALQQAYRQATVDKLDILLADSSNMSENGNVIPGKVGFVHELLPEASVFEPGDLGAGLYIVSQGAPWAKFFRRGFLDAKNLRFPSLKRTEDLPFVQMALSLACRIGVMFVPTVNHRTGVATSLESTKDDTPLIFAEAEQIFRSSLSRHRLLGKFRCAANVSHLVNIAYCLHRVSHFSSFRAIAQYCAEKFPELNLTGDEVGIRSFSGSFKRVSSVAAAADDTDRLAEIFADVQVSKRIRIIRDSCKEELAAKDAELEHLRGESANLRGSVEKQREAIAAKDAAVEKLRGAAVQLKGNIEKQREAIAAKDAALEQLRGATVQLKVNIEKLREAIAAKDAALEQLRGATAQLRGNLEKLREAIVAKDAALEQLRGNAEKQRKALATKDASLEQLRGVTAQLKGNIGKLREAIAAKDAALEQLRGVTAQLKGNIGKQREAIAAKDAALEQLRGNAEKQREAIAAKDAALEQLRGNAEKQHESIFAKNISLAEQSAAITLLRREIDSKQRLLDRHERTIGKLKGVVDL